MAEDADFDRIVDSLYDAALRPADWPGVLAEIAAWTGAERHELLAWADSGGTAPPPQGGPGARLRRVLPHLARACTLRSRARRLNEVAAIGEQIGMSCGYAAFGLDADATIACTNPQAQRLLQDADCLLARNGRLCAADAAGTRRLHAAVEHAARGMPAQTLALSGATAGPQACFVSVAAVGGSPAERTGEGRVLVLARLRGQRSAVSAQQLSQLFGLTAAEAAMALGLLDGKTPAEYAQQARLSMPTVRTHLRAIFDKTGTRRQAQAVSVLRDLPA